MSVHRIRAGGVLRRVCACLLAASTALYARVASAQTGDLRDVLRRQLSRSNYEIVAGRAAMDAAAARLRASGFAQPAQLSASLDEVPNGVDVADAGNLRVDLQREFLSRSRRNAARDLARAELASAEAALSATEQRLVAIAEQQIIRAVGWSEIGRRLAAEDSLLASAEAAIRSRFAAGDARYLDVLRLRTERLRVGNERALALADARAAYRSFAALVAIDDGAMAPSSRDSIETLARRVVESPLPAAPDVDSLIATSALMRNAASDIERARASQRLTLAEQRPRIIASIGAQRFRLEGGGPTFGPTIGASITLPFTARRANEQSSAAATHDVRAAEAEQRSAGAMLRGALLAARERYESARERSVTYESALLAGARDERAGALASYRSGELSLLELLDFERALSRAETERLRSRIDAVDALADLLTAATTLETRERQATRSTRNNP